MPIHRVHIPAGVPYFSFVVEYDPYIEEIDKTLTVTEAMEWAQEVKNALGLTGESHMVDAAVTMGAVPQAKPPSASPARQAQYPSATPPQQQYAPEPQGFVDHTLPPCPNDPNHPVRKGDKPFKTAKMRNYAYGVNCQVCLNEKGYPASVGLVNA